MEYIIQKVKQAEEKQSITREILEALPDWFGIEESREEYIRECATLSFFAAFDKEKAIGFVALKRTGKATAELCVMDVLGHSDVSTTMIYTHILNRGAGGVLSPLDRM